MRLIFISTILCLIWAIEFSTCSAEVVCPKEEDLSPCNCVAQLGYADIGCDDTSIRNGSQLEQIFSRISRDTKMVNQVFRNLFLALPSLVDIPANMIGNLKFEEIEIRPTCKRLQKIDSHAFDSSLNKTKKLEIFASQIPVSQSRNLLELFNKFTRLSYLFSTSLLDKFDSQTFSNLDNVIDLLLSVKKIEGSPFKGMSRLHVFKIHYGELNYIPAGALKIGNYSTGRLDIYLNNNNLNSSSFEKNAITDTSLSKMDVSLILNGNQITYLDESIFRSFLAMNKNNYIALDQNPLDCKDERSAWVCDKLSDEQRKRIGDANCKNGKKLTDCKD